MPVKLTIPAYVYEQYSDDDNIQAFASSQNTLTQEYVDFFNATPLPVYTDPAIAGLLLDWLAPGIYGMTRPVLPAVAFVALAGPFNTWAFDTLAFNDDVLQQIGPPFNTDDDTFKRVLTWHIYKADGKVFSVRWLKRRVMRFLFGVDGVDPPVDQTYRVSVTFGVGNQVDITILNGVRTIEQSAAFGTFAFNSESFNGISSSFTEFDPIPEAPIFKAAVDAGVLELPFQKTWVVTV